MGSYEPVQLAYSSTVPEDCIQNKSPILFLHGLVSSKEYWSDIPRLVADATKRNVYAIDARNHGDSVWNDIFTFDINVDDLLHFMNTMNIPKAIIVGHSLGGITGMKLALSEPERVEKLVVEDISVRKLSRKLVNMILFSVSTSKAAVERLPIGVDEETAKKFIIDYESKNLFQYITQHTKTNPKDYPFQLKRASGGRYSFKSNIDVIIKSLKDPRNFTTEPTGLYLGRTCFIYGNISPFQVNLDEGFIKNLFPNSEFVGIENATHDVHTDCPREFTETLLKFLQEE